MAHFALTAVGVDQPGIVAAVTGALVEAGCNLEDSSMTILRNNFAIVLVLDAPPGATPDSILAAVHAPATELGLDVTVRPVAEEPSAATEGATQEWTVTVYGADRPGIVHAITSVLARSHVNIVDLTTRVIGAADSPVYAMVLDVMVAAGTDMEALRAQLDATATELGVECSVHETAADLL
jgi:glycine cleavage system transcriptional repressor